MQLQQNHFHMPDEEKATEVNDPSLARYESLQKLDGVIDITDTEVTDASIRTSWQTFYDPETIDPLISKHNPRWYRFLRWTVFSTYRRLFAFCLAANVIALIALGATSNLTSRHCASAAAVNLLVAILARQEHVVNTLFRVSSAIPPTWPLWFRRRVAKIYCYGGWHSGCSIAAFVWYSAFVGFATRDYCNGKTSLLPTVILAYVLIVVLTLIIGFAHPYLRMRMHDYFELTHRFAGYTAIGIFWAQVVLLAHVTRPSRVSLGQALVRTPAFWCLSVITLCIVYPWIRLRKRLVRFEYLSAHAVRLHFTHARLDYCIGVRLTTNPLFETHSFATIPNKIGEEKGFSVIISKAGDWTSNLIQASKPVNTKTVSKAIESAGAATVPSATHPTDTSIDLAQTNTDRIGHIYTKGAPIYGVLRIAAIFRKPVIVTTGSGIGPCMSLLNGRPHHGSKWQCRILWATKSPVDTYGQALVNDVRRADPNARIVDTGVEGRPDMVALAWQLYKDTSDYRASTISNGSQVPLRGEGMSPEAVIVISNPKVTRKVVYGLECRGVPAYGVIFDS